MNMVSQKNKTKAIQFICDKLEDSRLYDILNKNDKGILVTEKPEFSETPQKIVVFIPNFLGTIKDVNQAFYNNQSQQIVSAPVLYKDGKTSFVRMVDNSSWRADKSLKRYTPKEINQMLSLRGKEKAVMDRFGSRLTFYQPETERLDESLKEFILYDVQLDYSHLDSTDEGYGFAKDRTSIDYKIAKEIGVIEPAAKFSFGNNRNFYLAKLVPAEDIKAVKEDLMKNAMDELGIDDPAEAYELMHPED